MNKTSAFLHNGSIGDVIASLPAIREYYRKTKKKVVLYLVNGQVAKYYEGAVHPTLNSEGEMVMLNKEMIDMLIPLLKAQKYIADAKMYVDEEIFVDLNRMRETFVNMPYHDLRTWYFTVYPDLTCDLSEKYIHVPDTEKNFAKNKIIIARSERYNNDNIDYAFLKEYEDDLIFSGTMREYNTFCMTFELNIKKLNISNFLELAQALKQSNGLVSNQTMIAQISEGIKIPRTVEACWFAPNVQPIGKNASYFYATGALEYFFKEMHKKTAIGG